MFFFSRILELFKTDTDPNIEALTKTISAFSLVGAHYQKQKSDDETIKHIFIFPKATTDRMIARLPQPKFYFSLNMKGTQITDKGLIVIARMKNLRSLTLSNTQISDKGLRTLIPLKNLTSLYIDRTRITDSGLKSLSEFKNLTKVFFDHSRISDFVITELKKVGVLHKLSQFKSFNNQRANHPEEVVSADLDRSQITVAGLKELATFKNLKKLSLQKTEIADVGLKVLGAFRNLEEVELTGSLVTEAGIQELKLLLPNCQITF